MNSKPLSRGTVDMIKNMWRGAFSLLETFDLIPEVGFSFL
jgi:hypothetical protein